VRVGLPSESVDVSLGRLSPLHVKAVRRVLQTRATSHRLGGGRSKKAVK